MESLSEQDMLISIVTTCYPRTQLWSLSEDLSIPKHVYPNNYWVCLSEEINFKILMNKRNIEDKFYDKASLYEYLTVHGKCTTIQT